eukprot:6492619-Amphidinium_carterae.1
MEEGITLAGTLATTGVGGARVATPSLSGSGTCGWQCGKALTDGNTGGVLTTFTAAVRGTFTTGLVSSSTRVR